MQIKVLITENEFLTGDLLKEKKPPVIEFNSNDGWTKRVNLTDIDKCKQFTEASKKFLLALSGITDNLSAVSYTHLTLPTIA